MLRILAQAEKEPQKQATKVMDDKTSGENLHQLLRDIVASLPRAEWRFPDRSIAELLARDLWQMPKPSFL